MHKIKRSTIQVAIADDHAVVREGVKSLLMRETDIEFIGESVSGDAAISLYRQLKPDVFLFDATMQPQSGLDVLQQIYQIDRLARVLIFSVYPDTQYALPYLRAGASGYLEKGADTTTLVEAIRHIARGKKYISQSLAAMLAEQLATPAEIQPHEELSAREYQVLLHLAAGKTLTRTAEEMGLSSRTISTYRKRILNQLNLRNNVDLVQYAFRHKLLFPV